MIMYYLEKLIYRILCVIKIMYMKLKFLNKITCKSPYSISLSTTFRISKKGYISLDNKVSTRKNVEFNANDIGIIKVGSGCFFNNNCIIASHKKIIIGNNCSFGPNVVIFDHDHDFRADGGKKSNKYKSETIIIGDNVWCGANVTILKGVKIGSNTVIAAGTIVKEDIGENVIYHSEINNKFKNI